MAGAISPRTDVGIVIPKEFTDTQKCKTALRFYNEKISIGGQFLFTHRLMVEGPTQSEKEFADAITDCIKKINITVKPVLRKSYEVPLLTFVQNPRYKVNREIARDVCLMAGVDIDATAIKVSNKAKFSEAKKS